MNMKTARTIRAVFFYFLRSFMNFISFFMKYVPYPMTTIMVTSVFRKSRMPMAITPIYDHCTIQGQQHGHTCHDSKSGFCVFRML